MKEYTIFVSNLHKSTTRQSIYNYFQECGAIESINLPLDATNTHKGFDSFFLIKKKLIPNFYFQRFALVEFETEESIEIAFNLSKNEVPLDGIIPFVRLSHIAKEEKTGFHGKVHFSCNWELILNWEELDLDAVVRSQKLEEAIFVNHNAQLEDEPQAPLSIECQGNDIPQPILRV